jgi:hypothetical protein
MRDAKKVTKRRKTCQVISDFIIRVWARAPSSVKHVARPSIATCPEQARRTFLTKWIVDSLLLRAAQDSICKYQGLDGVPFEERRDRVDDVGVVSHVVLIHEPPFQFSGFGSFLRD